jgi:catechol 2,3-dioxygenase-like lactoylglutathione lyase family enzyme
MELAATPDPVQSGRMGAPRLKLRLVTLGTPDVGGLLRFYERLLGWEVETDEEHWAVLRDPTGGVGLAFQTEVDHVPPTWPSRPADQQQQVHLEIEVDDLESASEHAVACGATVATFQPQEDVRVHLDPAGHPFCLYLP